MSHVPKRDNFPGNNDPYTVTPSTRVTGSINDTRHIYMWWLVWDGVMHRDCTWTDHDRPSLSGHTHTQRRTEKHMYKSHMRHNMG